MTEHVVEPGLVSVVVVNYRGTDDTLECLAGLQGLDWPAERLEVIVVDNASGDDGVSRIRAAFPDVEVIALDENVGFADGCNRGVEAARGQWVAFLNNDARPDPAWVRGAVTAFERDPSVACVASKILDWHGREIDYVGGALFYYGHGHKVHVGGEALDTLEEESDVLFASGAAMFVDARVFRQVGGFDGRYFMFFEDVDLGWRLWLLGHRVRYVPSSLAFHRHHATMARFGEWRESYLLERNALFTIYKNYDDENLTRLLAPALLLAVRRGVALGGDDPHALDLSRGAHGEHEDRISLDKKTAASAFAIDAFVEALPSLTETRAALQGARRRSDAEIMRLFGRPLEPNVPDRDFRRGLEAVNHAFGVEEVFARRRRIVVATGDTLQPTMAGPAIRAWQIARALSREHDVVLVTTGPCALTHADFEVRHVGARELRKLERWCDVFVFQGYLMHEHPFLQRSDKVIVVDIYDPFHLEQLEQARDLGAEARQMVVRSATQVLNQQLVRGDYFLCASEKQRDFWLGQLAAMGRVNPLTYDDDESLLRLVTVVPFGVSDTPPRATRAALKGVVPGIGPDDKVILWGGGIYNWFDPLTLLRAVDKLRRRLPEVRLYFLGLKHPNPHVPEMRMAVAARSLSDELGLTDAYAFFNEGWVEYEDRQNYLLESDVGVSTHLDHVETQFSFRTRILDYFWAGLPVVATGGDLLAEIIERAGVGLTVPPEDVDALEDALYRMLTDDDLRARARSGAEQVVDDFRWSRVLEPLVAFCRDPARAPDLGAVVEAAPMEWRLIPRRTWRRDVRVLVAHLRSGELRSLAAKARNRVRAAVDQRRS